MTEYLAATPARSTLPPSSRILLNATDARPTRRALPSSPRGAANSVGRQHTNDADQDHLDKKAHSFEAEYIDSFSVRAPQFT